MKKEKDAVTYNKLLILSKIAEGLSVEAISKLLNTHWYTVYRLASRWNKGGYEKIKVGAPKIRNAEKLSELIKAEKDGMVKQRLLVLKMIFEGRTVKGDSKE
ncbi:helix-turn-helix domain-containing protein [Athalassotoga sp.]|uniref:helix-turn-helix domain-containing protein n=1 Tax=Athalassotoga sp. TaxID=2022597 RepID=UPI003D01CE34